MTFIRLIIQITARHHKITCSLSAFLQIYTLSFFLYSELNLFSYYSFSSFPLNFRKSFTNAQKDADFGTMFPSLSRYSLQNSI